MAAAIMTGAKQPLDLSNPDVYNQAATLADFAVQTYNAKSNEINYDVLIKVISGTMQVVNGIDYDLTFYVAPTTCSKNNIGQHDVNVHTCPPDTNGIYHKCTTSFWVQPSSQKIQITDYTCTVVQKSLSV